MPENPTAAYLRDLAIRLKQIPPELQPGDPERVWEIATDFERVTRERDSAKGAYAGLTAQIERAAQPPAKGPSWLPKIAPSSEPDAST